MNAGRKRPKRKEPNRAGQDAAQSARAQRRLLGGLLVAVALVVLVVHWPALSARAVSFDDREYLQANPLVQNPSAAAAGRFLSEVLEPSTVGGYYQPLTMISLMIDHASGGTAVELGPFHRTSLLLHMCNAILLGLLVYLLFRNAWLATVCALLFGVHPITTESVAWVAERKTVLATFFAMGSLVLYVRYVRTKSISLMGCSLLAFLLALLAKPTVVPLPFLLVVLDWWLLRRLSLKSLVEKIPFGVLAAVSAIITVVSQGRTSVMSTPDSRSAGELACVVIHNIWFYPAKMLWPVDLSSHYPFPSPLTFSNQAIAAAGIGTIIIIVAIAISLRWSRAGLGAGLMFFLALAPTFGLISFTDTIAAIRFAYFPMIGFVLLVATILQRWTIPRADNQGRSPDTAPGGSGDGTFPRGAGRITLAIVACLVLVESAAARRHLSHWSDTDTLYAHMLAIAPDAPTLNYNRGVLYLQQGRPADAVAHLRSVAERQPEFVAARCDLAIALFRLKRSSEAIQCLNIAIEQDSTFARAHHTLGVILAAGGRQQEAEAAFRDAIRADQAFSDSYRELGSLLRATGRADEALSTLKEAIRIQPGSPQNRLHLGMAYGERGDLTNAIDQLTQAVQLAPGYVDAQMALGFAYEQKGERLRAAAQYRSVLQLNPNHAAARQGLLRTGQGL